MIKIVVDTREVTSGIPTILEELGAEVEVKMMEVGDYHVSNDIIIERKTVSDFLHSIIDSPGHLYGQLSDMMRNYRRSILIIEGEPTDLYTSRMINPNAIDGMILAAARFNASMIWTLSVDHTARMIYREAENEQIDRKKSKGSPHGKRSSMSLPQRQRYVISSIGNGVGDKVASDLLAHFKTVQAVIDADIDALCEVDGIGVKTAESIHGITRSRYKA